MVKKVMLVPHKLLQGNIAIMREEVKELKSDFPSCGDGKGDEFQELDAVLMEDNKVSEDVDRCLASPYSVSRKEKSESPKKECQGTDLNKSITVSSAVRLEKKKESLIPRTPKTRPNTFDMKENFTNTKTELVTKSLAKNAQPRRALEELGK